MMKTKYFLLPLLVLFLLSSCTEDSDKDDDNTPFPQALIIDGARQEIGEAFMINYGQLSNGNVNLDLHLVTDGITVIYSGGDPDSISGSGMILYFEAYSSDSTYLSAGTYNLDTTSTGNLFTVSIADVYTITNGNLSQETPMQSVSFEVLRDNTVYTIAGSGKLEDGKDFNFSYQGEIPIY